MAPTPVAAFAAACLLALFVWWSVGRLLPKLREIAAEGTDGETRQGAHAPRGGGLPMVGSLLAVLALWGLAFGSGGLPGLWTVLVGAVLLAMVFWRDDQERLPPGLRLAVQLAAVLLAIGGMVGAQPVTQDLLPLWADLVVTALAWILFISLFDFMDGLDGISAVETISVALGAAVLALLGGWPLATLALALLLIGGAAGFLPWNWYPAKVSLGGVGALPLGFLLGWLLVIAAGEGAWAAALILPAFYWADAAVTLLLRLLNRKKPWRSGRSHAYRRGLDQGRCSLAIAGFNLLLIALAVVAETWQPWAPLAATAVVTAIFTTWLRGGIARPRDSV